MILRELFYYDKETLEPTEDQSYDPQYDDSGGVDSERSFVKQIVQKFISDGSDENLFNEQEVKEATV